MKEDEANDTILKFTDLTIERSLGFGERDIGLRKISMEVDRSSVCALIGESGSGISLLARCLVGPLPPRTKVISGGIDFEGNDLLSLSRAKRQELRRRRLSFVGRRGEEVFDPGKTVRQSLEDYAGPGTGGWKKVSELDWSDCFYRAGIVEPERVLPRRIADLSLLTVQRIAIVRALLVQADVLICDHATENLDRVAEAQFLDLVRQLSSDGGLTILMATGSPRGMEEVADEVSVFYEGGILESGSATSLLRSPSKLYTRELLACVPHFSDHPRELPTISREAITEAEEAIHGSSAVFESAETG